MTQEKNKCQFLLSFTQLSIWNNNFLGNGFALATCSSAFKAFKHYILPYISYSMNSFCSSWSNNLCASQTCSFSNVNNGCKSVATLALGLRPKQGLARLWAKRRSLGVKGSVREWTLTLPRELPPWELESQWTHECSENGCKNQNPMDWRVLYTIGKLLKCRCQKWVRMTHLDIWNTSYGQKKGRKSNC